VQPKKAYTALDRPPARAASRNRETGNFEDFYEVRDANRHWGVRGGFAPQTYAIFSLNYCIYNRFISSGLQGATDCINPLCQGPLNATPIDFLNDRADLLLCSPSPTALLAVAPDLS